jgi:hypothetical protein
MMHSSQTLLSATTCAATSGFLIEAEEYASYARRLCSWGGALQHFRQYEYLKFYPD